MKWLPFALMFFAAFPSTSTYKMQSFGFGSGGNANSTTSNYALEGTTGEISGQNSSTTTYTVKPGFIQTQQAHLPIIASFDNNGGVYYNKLHFVINQQGNPTDALYSVSISTDNFASNVNYVKNDLTITNSLSLADYQTYATWGGAGGANVIGLQSSKTYYLRVKATQGKFSESSYGPIISATTASPQLTFSISTNIITFSSLLAGSVINAPSTIDITFATNAASGGDVYLNGKNAGLTSIVPAGTIPSASVDLSAASHGFGAIVTATGATSGTLSSVSPYNGVANNVGITDTTIRRIMTAAAPVAGGTGSVMLKAKAAINDPASTGYTETVTMLASASF
jgi:hypothetical protein